MSIVQTDVVECRVVRRCAYTYSNVSITALLVEVRSVRLSGHNIHEQQIMCKVGMLTLTGPGTKVLPASNI